MAVKKILIAEDERLTALALKIRLEKEGYAVIASVTRGGDAIEKAKTAEPDCILMDIFLEDDITGIDAVKRIHQFKKIPIIYISASQDAETYKEAEQTEFVEFIPKPYNFKHLLASMIKISK